MKKYILIIWVCLLTLMVHAQKETPIYIGTSSGYGGDENINIQHQISWTTNLMDTVKSESDTVLYTCRYPWDVLYQNSTFSNKGFFVSKGFYSNKIVLQWDVESNVSAITGFTISRKVYGANDDYKVVKRLGADVMDWEDKNTESGVLYDYKLKAEGVNTVERRLINFISGIGFRVPTATITGRVAFKGGTPVENVEVFADGSDVKGHCLYFEKEKDSRAQISLLSDDKNNNHFTWEAWVRTTGESGTIFQKGDLELIVLAANDDSALVYLTLNNEIQTDGIQISKSQYNHFLISIDDEERIVLFKNGMVLDTIIPTQGPDFSIYDMITLGQGFTGTMDEIRVWNRTFDESEVRLNYTRLMGGNEMYLNCYLRLDEGVGYNAYDISYTGITYHQNNAELFNIEWSDDIPGKAQLGVKGVTDENGSYIISGIPYAGDGESYKITPTFEKHKFEPSSQLLYIGENATVHNKVDFNDVSSFVFKGRVLYDLTGVFNGMKVEPEPSLELDKSGYNSFTDLEGISYPRGQYSLINNALYEFDPVKLKGATVMIDGKIVLDEGNRPIVTDKDGFFEINVPIGEHYISVDKFGHDFLNQGRFPAPTAEEEYKKHDFKEDAQDVVTFIDSSRVSVVGRVVGGAVEKEKRLGFGDDDALIEKGHHTSKNNIGQAEITFTLGSHLERKDTTNFKSGEYRIELIPENYKISNVRLLKDESSTIKFSEIENGDLPLNLANYLPEMPVVDTIFNDDDEVVCIDTAYYHKKQSFIYRAPATLSVTYPNGWGVNQVKLSNPATKADTMVNYSSSLFPIFMTTDEYIIKFEANEEYKNLDVPENKLSKIPVTDGTVKIVNNLARNTSEMVIELNEKGKGEYKFKAGDPSKNHQTQYLKNIAINFEVATNPDVTIDGFTDYHKKGIILGQIPGEIKDFVSGPELPKMILRDPPGSNSFTFLSKGTSFSSSTSMSIGSSVAVGVSATIGLGGTVTMQMGAPGATTELKNETHLDVTAGLSIETSALRGKELSETFTLTESWQTNADGDFVGSDGDLFIGNSQNYFLGTSDIFEVLPLSFCQNNLEADKFIDLNVDCIVDGEADKLAIANRKTLFFAKNGSPTMFMYSQAHIKNTLIPKYREMAGMEQPDSEDTTKNAAWFNKQATLWENILRDNEEDKYKASKGTLVDDSLKDKLKLIGKEDELVKNVSFDAGLGEYTSEIETESFSSKNFEWSVSISAEISGELGFEVNDIGITINAGISTEASLAGTENTSTTNTFNVGYTLADQDAGDYYSVEVCNTLDGNGPIFVTKGGRSQCPYEDTEYSDYFLNNGNQVQINNGTLQNQVPKISIEGAQNRVDGVPANLPAAYKLVLENYSEGEQDVWYQITMDESSNPDGAIVKIDGNNPNRAVLVKYGEAITKTLTIEKGPGDQLAYEKIGIVLHSPCDQEDIADTVFVSAVFQPACSKVSFLKPSKNWIVNAKSNNELNIKLGEYDRNLDNLEQISLQYKSSTSSSWTLLQTYFNKQMLYDASELDQDLKTLIESDQLNYIWKLEDLNDGLYDIKASSSCDDGSLYTTESYSGTIDREAPKVFGSPQPADGILSSNDDITIRFDETINKNMLDFTNISLRGILNQQKLDHNVSVYFNGNSNMIINEPIINSGSLSFEFWMKANQSGSFNVIQQGSGSTTDMCIGFDAEGRLVWTIAGKEFSSDEPQTELDRFQHWTVTYDEIANAIYLYKGGEYIGEYKNANINYASKQNIVIGEAFEGYVYDFRIWEKYVSNASAFSNMYYKLRGSEKNLTGYWPMDEAEGEIANDLAQFNDAEINAEWIVLPKGKAFRFENKQYLSLDLTKSTITDEMDMTIAFWFKTDKQEEACLFSNGKGDGSDKEHPENKLSIVSKSDGKIYVSNNGNQFQATNSNVCDNKWHHFALVVNRLGAVITYLDGEQHNVTPVSSFGGMVSANAYIGVMKWSEMVDGDRVEKEDLFFSGIVDEFRIWNLARTQKQLVRDKLHKLQGDEPGLVSYYPFEYQRVEGGLQTFELLDNEAKDFFGQRNGDKFVCFLGESFESNDVPNIKAARPVQSIDVSWVVNDDEIVINPNVTALSVLEKQVLDVTVRKIEDVYGNRALSPTTWTAYVDKNQLQWSTQGVQIDKELYETYTFTARIINKGGTQQNFNLSNLPNWLSADLSETTIAPNSYMDIEFVVDAYTNIGKYNKLIYLSSDFGYDEKFAITMNVSAKSPTWTVDANQFEHSMSVIGRLTINNVISISSDDMIAAFIGNTCRGVAHPKYIKSIDAYVVFMDIYSNVEDGEDVKFLIWNSDEGSVMEDVTPNMTFTTNSIKGSLFDPINFLANSIYQNHIELGKGWSWFSLNLDCSDQNDINKLLKSINATTGDQIKSHSDFTQFTDGLGWIGSLNQISHLNMHMCKLDKASTLVYKGLKADLSTTNIKVDAGWNWIGYLPNVNIPLNDALSQFKASQGDIIKSKKQFATYEPSLGWIGSLDFMKPGNGYMIKAAKESNFKYPRYTNATKSSSMSLAQDLSIPWICKEAQYPVNMSIIAKLEHADDIQLDNKDQLLLGAFSKDENRGSVSPKFLMGSKKGVYFLSIAGKETTNENIDFRVYDFVNNQQYQIKETFNFSKDKVIGSVQNPVILTVTDTKTSIQDASFLTNLEVTPNPFNDKTVFSFDLLKPQKVSLCIYSITGEEICTIVNEFLNAGTHRFDWNCSGANNLKCVSGVYIGYLISDGETKIVKIIKQ